MIVKELTIPPRIYMDMALLRRLSNGHPKRGEVSKDLARRRAGYRGEQNLYYHLSFLPQDDSQIFYDLGVSVNNRSCQIDTFLLYPSFCLILETKNLSGTLHVDPVFNQFIRSIDDKEEGFPNPILQVQRQKTLLNGWLCQHEMPVIPIEYLVVISNPSTLLKLVCETDPVPQTMLHAEQIVSKITDLKKKYTRKKLSPHVMQYIGNTLLAEQPHKDTQILKSYDIQEYDVIKGVQCPHCHSFSMKRVYGSWYCHNCQLKSKNAHEQAILDYFHLFDPFITNKQCQDFLLLHNTRIMSYLLTTTRLPLLKYGKLKCSTYESPPKKWLNDYYSDILN